MFRILTSITIIISLSACSNYSSSRAENRENIARLNLGMSKEQVMVIMGNNTASGLGETISNPYKREFIKTKNGNTLEVLYYYTEQIGDKNWEMGMTPVSFEQGKVVGIGWRFLDSTDTSVTIRNR